RLRRRSFVAGEAELDIGRLERGTRREGDYESLGCTEIYGDRDVWRARHGIGCRIGGLEAEGRRDGGDRRNLAVVYNSRSGIDDRGKRCRGRTGLDRAA